MFQMSGKGTHGKGLPEPPGSDTGGSSSPSPAQRVAQNLVVTVLVEGNPVLAVIDTAAQVTVVNARRAQEGVKGKESIPSFLGGIGDHLVPAQKVRNACFAIGNNPYTDDLYFADIEQNMLLGIDLLQ